MPLKTDQSLMTFNGSRLARVVLTLMGWRVLFHGLPGPRGVIAVYPHTSNWDFIIGLLAKWSIGIPVRFWGKDNLFHVPLFGRWLRWVGGIPIDRVCKHGVVLETVRQMQVADFFWLALAPEGTRKRISGWRSGFYRVACAASVPIGIAYFDYATKTVGITDFLTPTGDERLDMAHIAASLQGCVGYNPANMSPIELLDAKVARDESLTVT